MAQRDYVGRGKTSTRRKKTNSRKKRTSSGISKTMIALAVAVLITFIGGLYFIAHNKSEEAVILPSHGSHTTNGLPPKPEERWRYIKELENRQIGVQSPTEPTAGGEVQTPAQLTDEQRQLLEQMQADMRQQPIHLNEVPYNDQVKSSVANHAHQQNTLPVTQSRQATAAPVTPRPVFSAPAVRQAPTVQPPPHHAPATQQVQQQPRQVPATQQVQQQPRQAPATQQVQQQPRQAPVTTIQPTAPAKAQAHAEPKTESKTDKEKSQHWAIQCGSFKSIDQAESVRARLAFGGIESRIATSGGWNRVMVGSYAVRASADKSLQNLKGAGVSNCIPIASGG
ncbi:cell division protein FtsN [Acerihabitans sp. TG2]|uniref:cell division protein FtsN n=1 Tax=Acerihabitans sp. TG2 TaxID=3096008 RepID=UPI002B235AC5|nr:cell division protein FtsN [Acerihabitans sp. TG2]MEA9393038.1 cell division protein FtsN [Acerihabitans sp. TG2]